MPRPFASLTKKLSAGADQELEEPDRRARYKKDSVVRSCRQGLRRRVLLKYATEPHDAHFAVRDTVSRFLRELAARVADDPSFWRPHGKSMSWARCPTSGCVEPAWL